MKKVIIFIPSILILLLIIIVISNEGIYSGTYPQDCLVKVHVQDGSGNMVPYAFVKYNGVCCIASSTGICVFTVPGTGTYSYCASGNVGGNFYSRVGNDVVSDCGTIWDSYIQLTSYNGVCEGCPGDK